MSQAHIRLSRTAGNVGSNRLAKVTGIQAQLLANDHIHCLGVGFPQAWHSCRLYCLHNLQVRQVLHLRPAMQPGTAAAAAGATSRTGEKKRKERKGKERKGKERKGKERKGKERKGKEKEKKKKERKVPRAEQDSLMQCNQSLQGSPCNISKHCKQSSPVKIQKEKKRKDYAFRRQFDVKPSVIPGCPSVKSHD